MRQSTVTFAMRDFDRLKCIQAVIDGELKPIRAAGISTPLGAESSAAVYCVAVTNRTQPAS